MRKLLVIPYLLLALLAAGACNSGNKSDSNDSVGSDSMAAVEIDTAAERARLEALRLDSLRRDSIEKDSIAKLEGETFADKLPDPASLLENYGKKRGNYLSSLGFKGKCSAHAVDADMEPEYNEGNYLLTGENDMSCKITWSEDMHSTDINVQITGSSEALDIFFNKAIKLRSSGVESGTSVTRRGDTVSISSFGA